MNYSAEKLSSVQYDNQQPVGYDSHYDQHGHVGSSDSIPSTSVASSTSQQPRGRSGRYWVQERENIPDLTNAVPSTSVAETSQQQNIGQNFNWRHTRHPMTDFNYGGFPTHQQTEEFPVLFNAEWPASMTFPHSQDLLKNYASLYGSQDSCDDRNLADASNEYLDLEQPSDILQELALAREPQHALPQTQHLPSQWPELYHNQPEYTIPQFQLPTFHMPQGYQALAPKASLPAPNQLGPVRHSFSLRTHKQSLPYQHVGSSKRRPAQDSMDSSIESSSSSSAQTKRKRKRTAPETKVRKTLSTSESIRAAFKVTTRGSDTRARLLCPNPEATLNAQHSQDSILASGSNPDNVVNPNDDLPMIPCPLAATEACTERLKGLKALEMHLSEVHKLHRYNGRNQEQVRCSIGNCNATVGKGNLNRHVAECHSNVWYYCTLCDTGRSRKHKIKLHFLEEHPLFTMPTVFREILHENKDCSLF